MSPAVPIDTSRVIADLRELARRTGDEGGAQRLCWTPAWEKARDFERELLAEIGVTPEIDEAGNLWAEIPGADRGAPVLALGSHIDSVPDGGWLDGALGVMAALGALRAIAESGQAPPAGVCLVDWADEEGARFGRSLFGSSAFSGDLDPAAVAGLTDADGGVLADVLAEYGVDLEMASQSGRRGQRLGAYLELHIEQGPRLEAASAPVAAVAGCLGIERLRFRITGQAAHAGTTPMASRRDAGLAAAEVALAIERLPSSESEVATCGELRLQPGIATAVAGMAELTADLRAPRTDRLDELRARALRAAGTVAKRRRCELTVESIWQIAPTEFDTELVAAARRACEATLGAPATTFVSGALHDAAEVARMLPAAMMFCPSIGGISHAPIEDTAEADLLTALSAYGAWVGDVLGSLEPDSLP